MTTAALSLEVNCRMADPLLLNIGSDAAKPLPADIQWMPPGRHSVWPEGFDQEFEIDVTPQIAETANAQLQHMRSLAADGKGNWPFLDFNHEDRDQSAEPVRIYWGGTDPKTGGVRMAVNWSAAGEQAVRGKAFRSFSPSWRLHKDTHAFLGIRLNVGGLVNRSAFKSIQAVARGAASTETNNQKDSMTEAEKQEIVVLIAGAVKPLTEQLTAMAKLPERLTVIEKAVKAKGAEGEEGEANKIIILLDERLKPINEKLTALEGGASATVTANAKKTVEELGVKAGRIGAQDKETIEFWTGAIAVNAKAADALAKMPVNPAFVKVVQDGANGGGSTATGNTHEFVVKAKEYAKAHDIKDELTAQAKFAGTKEGKQLYGAYRETLAGK